MIKEIFDRAASFLALVFLSPILVLIGILVKLDSEGPALHVSYRVGKDFKAFKLYKFRTMLKDAGKEGPSITTSGDLRITRVGRSLRKYKLDELPQLLNVLKGDMSIVGPRPEAEKYVKLFKEDYRDILKIKPGITDYATIEFRDEEHVLSRYEDSERGYIDEVLPRKILLYRKYIVKKSFLTDIGIILRTLVRIVTR